MLQPGAKLRRGYTIQRVIGQGGMGTVYLARHTKLKNKKVAIKSMVSQIDDPSAYATAVAQFEKEAEILASIEHPGVVDIRDYFEEDGVHYLVEEFIPGVTMAAIIEQVPQHLPMHEVLDWMDALCDVLHFLHTYQPPIIVRDLKPDNVMIDANKKIHLIDFGIARVFDPGSKTENILKGTGTIGYAPVEQYGAGTTDARSDIYALGATLYAALTTRVAPWSVDLATGEEELTPPTVYNPYISKELEAVILKMMAVRKDDRYQTAAEVRNALREARKTVDNLPNIQVVISSKYCTSCGATTVPRMDACPSCNEPYEEAVSGVPIRFVDLDPSRAAAPPAPAPAEPQRPSLELKIPAKKKGDTGNAGNLGPVRPIVPTPPPPPPPVAGGPKKPSSAAIAAAAAAALSGAEEGFTSPPPPPPPPAATQSSSRPSFAASKTPTEKSPAPPPPPPPPPKPPLSSAAEPPARPSLTSAAASSAPPPPEEVKAAGAGTPTLPSMPVASPRPAPPRASDLDAETTEVVFGNDEVPRSASTTEKADAKPVLMLVVAVVAVIGLVLVFKTLRKPQVTPSPSPEVVVTHTPAHSPTVVVVNTTSPSAVVSASPAVSGPSGATGAPSPAASGVSGTTGVPSPASSGPSGATGAPSPAASVASAAPSPAVSGTTGASGAASPATTGTPAASGATAAPSPAASGATAGVLPSSPLDSSFDDKVATMLADHTLTAKELEGYNERDLAVLRWGIYAFHGLKFEDDSMRDFFESRPWYHENRDGTLKNTKAAMNATELKNEQVIEEYQKEHHFKSWVQ